MNRFIALIITSLALSAAYPQQQYTFSGTESFWSTNSFPNTSDESEVGNDVAANDSLVAIVLNHTGENLRVDGVGQSVSATNNGSLLVFDKEGTFLYERSDLIYSSGTDAVTVDQVLFDLQGNIVVAGTFTGSTVNVGLESLSQSANMATFVVKYDINGDVIWGTVLESSDTVEMNSLDIDSQGNLIMAGRFQGSGFSVGTDNITSKGEFDGFVASLDADGNGNWVSGVGNELDDGIYDVFVTPEDSILIAGAFSSDTLFVENDTLVNGSNTSGGYEGLAMSFDGSSGSPHAWQTFSTGLDVYARQIVGNGNTWYVAVQHRGVLYGNNASTQPDIQLVKFESNVTSWNKLIRSSSPEDAKELVLLNNGNLIIAGETEGVGIQIGLLSYPGSSSSSDFFVFELNSSGDPVRGLRKNQSGDESINAIAANSLEEFWTVGSFQGTSFILDGDTIFNTDFGLDEAWLSQMSLNNLPQGLNMTPGNSIAENSPDSTYIGSFTVSDPDADETYDLSFVSGHADNNFFQLTADNELVSEGVFDFETKSSYTLKLRASDSRGGIKEIDFNIAVTNVNEQPTSISLSDTIINEAYNAGTLIGSFTTIDEDNHPDGFLYTLVSDTGDNDNEKFSITGDKLYLDEPFDFETQTSATINVQTDDQSGETFQASLALSVQNNIVSTELAKKSTGLVQYGGNDEVTYHSLTLDSNGNRYFAGSVAGDSTEIGEKKLGKGKFIASFSASMAFRWAINVDEVYDLQVYKDTLYVASGGFGTELRKYNPAEGTAVDTLPFPSCCNYRIETIHNDTIYVSQQGEIVAYDLSANELFQIAVGDKTPTGVIVDDDHIYVTTSSSGDIVIGSTTVSERSSQNNAFLFAFNHDLSLDWSDVVGISDAGNVYPTGLKFGANGTISLLGYNSRPTGTTYTITNNAGSFTTNDYSYTISYQSDGSELRHVTYPHRHVWGEVDAQDNLYVIGESRTTGEEKVYKYGSSGNLIWEIADVLDYSMIAFDGNILSCYGEFSGSFDFGGETFDAFYGDDIFLMNLSEFGVEQQAISIGNPGGSLSLNTLGTQMNNVVTAAGSLSGELVFGEDTLRSTGSSDIVIVAYDYSDDIKVNSAQVLAVAGDQYVDNIASDELGNYLVWDEGSYTDGDDYLVKFNSTDTLWTREYGPARIADVVFTSEGNIYVAALLRSGSVTIGGDSFTNSSSANSSLIFKLDTDGNVIWVKEVSGSSWINANELIADDDSVYVAGYFSGSLSVNSDNLSTSVIGVDEVFLLKLDHNGNSIFSRKYAKSGNYRFLNGFHRIHDYLYMHNRDNSTGKEEIVRLDLAGTADTLYQPSFSNLTNFNVGDNKIYLSRTTTGENVVLDVDFNELLSYPTSTNYYGHLQVDNDTLLNLKNNDLSKSVIRTGPEGFALEFDTVSENYTGFVSKIIPETAGVTPNYAESSGAFSISNDSLFLDSPINFESYETYNLGDITYTDPYGDKVVRKFTIGIQDVNESPTNISFTSAGFIYESDPVGTAIGYVSASDPDASDTEFTFTPADSLSEIYYYVSDDDSVRVAKPLDFEVLSNNVSQSSYSIYFKLSATDAGGLSYESSIGGFTLFNVNELPLSVDTLTVSEDTSPGGGQQYLGVVRSADPDYYSFYTGNNYFLPEVDSVDNSLFYLSSSSLYSSNDSTINYEVDSVFHLTVGVHDSGYPDTVYLPMVVKLTDANDPIQNIQISGDTIPENSPVGTPVGVITWEDEDAEAGYRMTVNWPKRFEFREDTLVSSLVFDYESTTNGVANGVTTVQITVDDTVSNSSNKVITYSIRILDRNDPPEIKANSILEFNENDTTDTYTFSVTDEDEGDQVMMTLIDGEGDSLNSLFIVDSVEHILIPAQPLDFESQPRVSARLRLTDSAGASVDSVFVFDVNDRNDPAYNIQLTSYQVNEYTGTQERFAEILFEDEDEESRSTYQFSKASYDGEVLDNDLFSIITSTGEVYNNFNLNYENLDSNILFLRVSIQDDYRTESFISLGTVYANELMEIEVINVNEPPTNLQLASNFNSISENTAVGTFLSAIRVDDPEGKETVSFTTDYDGFEIRDDSIFIARPLDFETEGNLINFHIVATDTGGLSTQINRSFNLGNVTENEASFGLFWSSVPENAQGDQRILGGLYTTLDGNQVTSTYDLVSGEGDDHNDLVFLNTQSQFADVAVEIAEGETINYEEIGDTLRFRVMANALGLIITGKVPIDDINEAPYDLILTGQSIDENLAVGTEIGVLSSSDDDVDDEIQYSISSSENAVVEGDLLLSAKEFDFEASTSFEVAITATDLEGLSITESFTISIINDVTSEGELVLGTNPNDLRIYPNPAKDLLFLDERLIGASYILTDVSGKEIKRGVLEQPEMDIRSMDSGVYQMQFIKADETVLNSLIVIRR